MGPYIAWMNHRLAILGSLDVGGDGVRVLPFVLVCIMEDEIRQPKPACRERCVRELLFMLVIRRTGSDGQNRPVVTDA